MPMFPIVPTENSGLSYEEYISAIFKSIFSNHFLPFYACNSSGKIIYYNDAAVDLWGQHPKEDALWTGAWKTYNLDGSILNISDNEMQECFKKNLKTLTKEILIELPDSTLKLVASNPKAIFDDQNQAIIIHNSLMDITHTRKTEEQQSIFSDIVKHAHNAIISKDLNGIITSWNTGAEKTFGYTEEEMIGQSIVKLIPKDRLHEEENIINNIKGGKRVDHYQTIRLKKDGSEIHVSISISPIFNNNGEIIGASKIARDISLELAHQQAFRRYSENLEVLNSVGRAISEKLDVQAILQKVIDATTKVTGASFGAFLYKTTNSSGEEMMLYNLSGASREIFDKMEMPRQTSLLHQAFNGNSATRIDDVTKDARYGQNKPYNGMPAGHLPVKSYLSMPVKLNSGRVIGGLLFGHEKAKQFTEEHEDILSSIAAQAAIALDNSELFEEIKSLNLKKDEFIALASHELKTPLTSIKGYLQILSRSTRDKEMSDLFVNKALIQVGKLESLVSDLLNVSKIEAGKLQFDIEVLDMRQLVLESIENFSYTSRSHKIILDDIKSPLIIEGDKQRLEQVIINLLSNAVKYSPKSNQVEVFLSSDEENTIVSVKDTGLGLSSENQKNIFTRFYRAEGVNNISGLGLGLYLTKEIIERHQGKIMVESELGQGAKFTFTLPLFRRKADQ